MSEERFDRKLIAHSENHKYYIPPQMEENTGESNHRINPHNVLAGLQWFQAYKNGLGDELSPAEKAKLLLDIFREPNDLISLARVVEMQTGVEGLIEGIVTSYPWSEWKITPTLPNVTEIIYLKKHIDVSVTVGNNSLSAVSSRSVRLDKGKGRLVELTPEFKVYEGGEEIDPIEFDEHDILPFFSLRFVDILVNRRIRLEGIDTDEDAEELEGPKRLFFSYILSADGQLGCEAREKIDREIVLRQLTKVAEGPFSIVPEKDGFDWINIREKITRDPLAQKALVHFLLPYCEIPTTTGEIYVLPED